MSEDNTTVYIVSGTSPICKKENKYYVRTEGVKQYLESLNSEFPDLNLLSVMNDFDTNGIEPLNISSKNIHPQSTTNIPSFFVDIIKNAMKIFRNDNKEQMISIIFLPGIFHYLIALPLLIISDEIILYYMSNPRKVMSDRKKVTPDADKTPFILKKIIYYTIDRLLMSKANIVLYRDESVVNKSKYTNTKFVRSKPLIAVDDNDIYVRKDTCTEEPFQILFVGSLIPRKGIRYLLEGFSMITENNENHSFQLDIVGDGVDRKNLEDLAAELNVNDRVDFKGHVANKDKLLKIYRRSDIFILPSIEEGFPRVIVEAMAQGLPVITTKVGEIPNRLKENEAILIEPEEKEEIASAIERLVDKNGLRQNIINNGNTKIKSILSTSAAEQHISLIKSVQEVDQK